MSNSLENLITTMYITSDNRKFSDKQDALNHQLNIEFDTLVFKEVNNELNLELNETLKTTIIENIVKNKNKIISILNNIL